MKKTMFALTMTLALNAQADDLQYTCESFSQAAYSIMDGRQHGIAMSGTMEPFREFEAVLELIKMAYKEPRHSTEERKREAQEEFRDFAYMQCLENRGK